MNAKHAEQGLAMTLRSIAEEVGGSRDQRNSVLANEASMRKRLGEMIVAAYSGRTTIVGA